MAQTTATGSTPPAAPEDSSACDAFDKCCPRNSEECCPQCDLCQGCCPCEQLTARRWLRRVFYVLNLAYIGYIAYLCINAYLHPTTYSATTDVDSVAAPGVIVCPIDGIDKPYPQTLYPAIGPDVCTVKRAGSPPWNGDADTFNLTYQPCGGGYSYVTYAFSSVETVPRVCLDVAPGTVFFNSRDLLEIRFTSQALINTTLGRSLEPISGCYYALYTGPADRSTALIQLGVGGITAVAVQPTEYIPLRGSSSYSFNVVGNSGAEMVFGYSENILPANITAGRVDIARYYSMEIALYAGALQIAQTGEVSALPWLGALGVIAGMYATLRQLLDLCLGGADDDAFDPKEIAKAATAKAEKEAARKAAYAAKCESWRRAYGPDVPLPEPDAEAEAPNGWIHRMITFEAEPFAPAREDRLASFDIRALNVQLAAGNQFVTAEVVAADRKEEPMQMVALPPLSDAMALAAPTPTALALRDTGADAPLSPEPTSPQPLLKQSEREPASPTAASTAPPPPSAI